jgi:hypothetical protein
MIRPGHAPAVTPAGPGMGFGNPTAHSAQRPVSHRCRLVSCGQASQASTGLECRARPLVAGSYIEPGLAADHEPRLGRSWAIETHCALARKSLNYPPNDKKAFLASTLASASVVSQAEKSPPTAQVNSPKVISLDRGRLDQNFAQ